MTKVTVFLVSLLISHFAIAQIRWSHPQPSGFACKKIKFTDPLNGFALTTKGELLKTSNQGASWEIKHQFSEGSIFDIKDSIAIVAGNYNVYISSDYGNTWQKSPTSVANDLIDADIVSGDTIFMAGIYRLYKSYDRGKTWQIDNLLGEFANINCFDFVNSKIGFIGRSNTSMLKTIDGGITWQSILRSSYSNASFTAIKFLNANTGYAHRENDTLYKTLDCGVTWQRSYLPGEIYGIDFPGPSIGYLVGESGAVWNTNNGGNTWERLPRPGDEFINTLTSVYFVSPSIGFAAGYWGRMYKTVDGGLTWQTNYATLFPITGLSFTGGSGNVGYASSWYSALKTTDGAKSWTRLAITSLPNQNTTFDDTHFFSKDTGFFVSNYPAIMYNTTDGGQTWQTKSFSASPYHDYEQIASTSFLNDSTGFIHLYHYTYGYAIYKTTNRGINWEKIDSTKDGQPNIGKIHFLNEGTAFAAAGYSLLKTTDSARHWVTVSSYVNPISNIFFWDQNNGIISQNTILKRTNDGGNSWSEVLVDESAYPATPILAINFNGRFGYYTSSYGRVYQSIDSGYTWNQYGATYGESATIAFRQDSLVYLGGEHGNIAYLALDTSWGTVSACHTEAFTFISNRGYDQSNFQWQVNKDSVFQNITDDGIYSGTKTRQLDINRVSPTWTNYQYRCMFSDNLYSKIYSFRFKAKWTGAMDTYWDNSGNWSCGVVPDGNTDVEIGSGPVVIRNNATIRSLSLNAGVSLTLSPGVILNILH